MGLELMEVIVELGGLGGDDLGWDQAFVFDAGE